MLQNGAVTTTNDKKHKPGCIFLSWARRPWFFLPTMGPAGAPTRASDRASENATPPDHHQREDASWRILGHAGRHFFWSVKDFSPTRPRARFFGPLAKPKTPCPGRHLQEPSWLWVHSFTFLRRHARAVTRQLAACFAWARARVQAREWVGGGGRIRCTRCQRGGGM